MKVEKFKLIDNRNKDVVLDTNEIELLKIFKKLRYNLDGNLIVNGTVEVIGSSLKFDPFKPYFEYPGIRSSSKEYIEKELDWYLSQSLSINGYVDDIKIWREVATKKDQNMVNSNYGFYVFNEKYGDGIKSQYEFALEQLLNSLNGRQSVIFYNRPQMQFEWNDGIHADHDFTCCFETWQAIRNNKLEMIVNFRSNDIIFGLFNDFYWMCFIYQKLYNDLKHKYNILQPGNIQWNAASLHCYERHYDVLKKITDNYY